MDKSCTVYVWKHEIDNFYRLMNNGIKFKKIAETYGITEKQLKKIFIIFEISWNKVYGRKNKNDKEKWLSIRLLNRSGDRKIPRDEIDAIYKSLFPLPNYCPVLGCKLYYDDRKGLEPQYVPSLDRVDSSKGYIAGNIAIISYRANVMKSCGDAKEHQKIAEFIDKFMEKKEVKDEGESQDRHIEGR